MLAIEYSPSTGTTHVTHPCQAKAIHICLKCGLDPWEQVPLDVRPGPNGETLDTIWYAPRWRNIAQSLHGVPDITHVVQAQPSSEGLPY